MRVWSFLAFLLLVIPGCSTLTNDQPLLPGVYRVKGASPQPDVNHPFLQIAQLIKGTDKFAVDSEHPPGHPDWDWYCPDVGGIFYPQITLCNVPWGMSPDGPTSAEIAQDKANRARIAAQMREQKEATDRVQRESDAYTAKMKKEEADRQIKEAALRSEDSAEGYNRTTVVDFLLDYKTLPEGTKLVLSGIYERIGSAEFLVTSPESTNTPIMLNTDSLPRENRKRVLELLSQGYQGLRATVRVHTGCSVTKFGMDTSDPCLIVDDMR